MATNASTSSFDATVENAGETTVDCADGPSVHTSASIVGIVAAVTVMRTVAVAVV